MVKMNCANSPSFLVDKGVQTCLDNKLFWRGALYRGVKFLTTKWNQKIDLNPVEVVFITWLYFAPANFSLKWRMAPFVMVDV